MLHEDEIVPLLFSTVYVHNMGFDRDDIELDEEDADDDDDG